MEEKRFVSRSGQEYTLRAVQPEDTELLVELFYHLSPETIYKRFHTVLDPQRFPRERVEREARRVACIDPQIQAAIIALCQGELVGVAHYHRLPGTAEAEAAIVVRDDFQRDGLGTRLLENLRVRAQEMGITHLTAMVQAHNNPILKVIKRSGLKSRWRFERGEAYLAVDIRDQDKSTSP